MGGRRNAHALAAAAGAVVVLLGAGIARAHVDVPETAGSRYGVVLVLGTAALAYVVGWGRLRRRGRSAVAVGRLGLHLLGLGAVAVALLSPLDGAALETLPAHMVQHLLLTMVAAPALVLSGAFPVIAWTLPATMRPAFASALGRVVRRTVAPVTSLTAAGLLAAATLWLWHVPAAYEAALRHPWAHDVEHVSFFASALVFWGAIVDPAPRLQRATGDATRMVALFAATSQNAALAAWIALAGRVLYPYYAGRPDALGEQQVAGVVMLAAGTMMYVAAALLVAARLLRRGDALASSPVDVAATAKHSR